MYVPKGTNIEVVVKVTWYDNSYSTLIVYEVDGAKFNCTQQDISHLPFIFYF